MLIKKTIYDSTHRGKPSGWLPDELDQRDYSYEDYFVEEIFGAALPDKFIRTTKDLPSIHFQDSILSCVHASFAFANSYNSLYNSNNEVKLAWRYTYCQVPHYSGGTTFRDCANVLRKQGQCINSLLPEELYWYGEKAMQSAQYITPEAKANAENYKIGGYFYIKPYDEFSIKSACQKSPVIIGLYCNRKNWKTGEVITWNGIKQYGHAICIVGWDDTKEAWQLTDWDNKGFKWLSYEYPIFTALTIRDLPDGLQEKTMKLVKTKNDPKIYVLLPNGKKQHITSPKQLQEGLDQGIFSPPVKLVTQKELDEYPVSDHPFHFSL